MRGVWTALVTPFDSKLQIDFDAFRRILKDQREAGITGVIPCGTTGESPTLTLEEKKKLIRFTVDELKGSGVKVLAGTGSNSTADTVEFSKWASDQGVDGVLVVTPYYNKPQQKGLEEHFLAVANAIQCELMLYNVPGRTAVTLTPAIIATLAKHPRIRSVKEATGNVSFTSDIIDQLHLQNTKIDILSGDDGIYLPLLTLGATGVISVASNLFPRGMVALQRAFDEGRLDQARSLHERYYPLFRDLFVETNPVPIKHAMARMGWCDARVRAPLAPISAAGAEVVEHAMTRAEILKGTPA